MPRSAHQVDTAGTGKLIMSLPTGKYDSVVGPVVGIIPLAGAAPAGSFSETSVAGVRKGLLGSVKISYKVGIAKPKTTSLLCSLEKMDTCITELPGKAYLGGVIISARFPVRKRLR